MKNIFLLLLIFSFTKNVLSYEKTEISSLLSAIWKLENPRGSSLDFDDMSETELVVFINSKVNKLKFENLSKMEKDRLLNYVYRNINGRNNDLFLKIFNKLNALNIKYSNSKIYFEHNFTTGSALYALITTCNLEIAKKIIPQIEDYSQPLISYTNYNSTKKNNKYYIEPIYGCYESANRDPRYLSPERVQYYKTKREFFGEAVKKAMYNFGKPLQKFNARSSMEQKLDSEMLLYYVAQGYGDESIIKNNTGVHLRKLIQSGANSYQVTQFIKKYEINIKEHSSEIEKALRTVNNSYDGKNFNYIYKINSILLKQGLELKSDLSPLKNFLRDTVEVAAKTQSHIFKDSVMLIDLYFKYSKVLQNSQLAFDRLTSLWNEYLKIYLSYKRSGDFKYSIWQQDELSKMIDLGMPFKVVTKLISKGFDIHHLDKYGRSPVFYAVKGDQLELVEYLFKKNVKVKYWDISGDSPLSQSVSVEMLKLFIKYKHDITIQNRNVSYSFSSNYSGRIYRKNGHTIAHIAARLNSIEILREIEKIDKSMLSKKDSKGKRPIHYATGKGHIKIVKYLQQFSDIKETDTKGRNLLFFAIQANNLSLVKSYVRKGLSVFKPNHNGITPYDFAFNKVGLNKEILEYLSSLYEGVNSDPSWNDAKDATRIFMLITEGRLDVLENIFLNNKNLLDVKDEFGITPLIFAVNYKNIELVSMLVDLGVNINVRDDFGMTALEHARDLKLFEIENYLTNFVY